MDPFVLLITVIVLAFTFDFLNGFHDAANAIATIVSTRVLTPFQAVLWAGLFNFVAYWISEFKVADTVSKTVNSDVITLQVIIAGLIAAIIWNLLTWWLGIPSSSSHTLIGGFAGAAVAHAGGFDVVNIEKVTKVIVFIFLAPMIGMFVAYSISIILMWISRRGHPRKLDRWFRRLQLFSSAMFSIGHGGNDAQKVMGIISAALIVYVAQAGYSPEEIPKWMFVGQKINEMGKMEIHHIPEWVVIGCYSAIALGTMSGGWRIVKTMGSKITKITSFEGVVAETSGAITLFATERLGIPVSTTHTITGSIIGVGMTKRLSAVRWGVARNIIIAWILTIPASMLIAALVYFLLSHFI